MHLVAGAHVEGGLREGGMKRSGGIEFGVHLQSLGKVVAHHEAGQPAVRSQVDEVISGLGIEINGPNFFRNSRGISKLAPGGVIPVARRDWDC